MEPEICTKMRRNLNEKLRAKFPATARGYSMAKIARLDDAFSEVFEREAGQVEGKSLQQKDKKRRKRKGTKGVHRSLFSSVDFKFPVMTLYVNTLSNFYRFSW